MAKAGRPKDPQLVDSQVITIKIGKAKLVAVKYAAWVKQITVAEFIRRAIETALDSIPVEE